MVETFDQSKSYWVTRSFKYNWDRGAVVFGGQRPRSRGRGDDSDLPVDEIRREARQSFEVTVSPPVFDIDILTVNVTSFLQPGAECDLKECALVTLSNVQESDHRLGRLLRARCLRAKCGSAQKTDEFASAHVPPGSETLSTYHDDRHKICDIKHRDLSP